MADDVQPSQIRIGDAERQTALTALGEHMSAGRLDIDEYGDRSAQVSTAKTRGELLGLFADLPAPHPSFGVEPRPAPPNAPPAAQPVPVSPSLPLRHRLAGAAVPMAVVIALALYFLVAHYWIVFLIPAAVMVFGGAIWGDDWKHQQRLTRERHRRERRDIRRRGW
ncbi:MAG TPA: DUF1707 domain-containing protein [Pseudonocardiaceae bacterium]|nr:DUF1707 domain-containing protein [Pseudonocardiaceae bacterium]